VARKSATRTTLDDPKSARTRERILDSTAKVLSSKGYSETRLTDVAEEAELQSPAIYYYFNSREELIEEVMWAGIAHMREHVEEVLDALPPETSALDRILAASEAHLRYSLAVSNYTTAAIRNSGQMPERIRARHEAERAKYGRIWRKLFKDAADDGEIRPDLDLMTLRMLVLGSLNWAAEWWNPRTASIETVVATAHQLIRNGIAAEPASNGKARTKAAPRSRAKAATS
jgi:AcrR family transcriptional regulator